jgi:type II secretory pathway component PulJ
MELIVAAALAALILMLTAQVFRSATLGRERLINKSTGLGQLRRTFETLNRDIHSATVPPDDSGMEFGLSQQTTGGSEVLQFASVVGEPLLAGRMANETVLVQYAVAEHPETGVPTLWRYETPYPVPEGAAPGASDDTRAVPLLSRVTAATFLFYSRDQATWVNTWEGETGLPMAIRVDLAVQPENEQAEPRQESWVFNVPSAGYAADEAAASEAAASATETGQ